MFEVEGYGCLVVQQLSCRLGLLCSRKDPQVTDGQLRFVLTRSTLRSAWGQPSYNPPSRFLEEIPAPHLE
ncbi:hypothetical protein, partial [Streptomyces rochei]|uniref:hypothetical protein n=1 Tax=Streptomyces rochei TaxID=1928 RepID=UPI0033A67DF8